MSWKSKGVVSWSSTGRSLKVELTDKDIGVVHICYVSVGDLRKVLEKKKKNATLWVLRRGS